MSLATKHRPDGFEKVIGNAQTVASLKGVLSREDPPHALLFSGPTGCGKTTLARIALRFLGCSDFDFDEKDSADFRGIDSIREIRRNSAYAALNGSRRGWLLDECFAKGTLVSTPFGGVPIEKVQPGDLIFSARGLDRVRKVFRNPVHVSRVVQVVLSNSTVIFCTEDHLFFVQGCGWVRAAGLVGKDVVLDFGGANVGERGSLRGVFRCFSEEARESEVLQSSVCQQICGPSSAARADVSCAVPGVRDLYGSLSELEISSEKGLQQKVRQYPWREESSRYGAVRGVQAQDVRICKETLRVDERDWPKVAGSFLKTNEREQSGLHARSRRESQQLEAWKALHGGSGRERPSYTTPDDPIRGSRLAYGAGSPNRICSGGKGVPVQLQDRHWESVLEDWDRSGRNFQRSPRFEGEEGWSAQFSRVESVTFYKSGHNDGSFQGAFGDQERSTGVVLFYDLEVEGHPSYFANGVLVHNCHQLTKDAASALLKGLEEPPSHCFFALATTEPEKLLPTIRSRCVSFAVKPLNSEEMILLLRRVTRIEGAALPKAALEAIAEASEGLPRTALQILEKVLGGDPNRYKEAIEEEVVQRESIELCRGLLNGSSWKSLSAILAGIRGEDPERVRRAVLGYCTSVLLSGENDRAGEIMEIFSAPLYDTGFPGLVYASYTIARSAKPF